MPPSAMREPRFPFLDLKAQFAGIRHEVNAAVSKALESQHFILGPEVEAFEEELKPHVGCQYAFGCASGSDALLLALMALGIGPGDEVIAPPFTFVATIGAIERLRARTVFVDIDPETFNLSPDKVAKAVTPKTKAIVPVHLFGLAADMDPILEIAASHKLAVIEDAAQAIGARYKGKPTGSMGTIGCFSFFPSKNLGGAGDGGLVTTNDRSLAEKLKILRLHGSRTKYHYDQLGINSRLDAIQAAILRVKLKHLDAWTRGRRRNAERYRELFAEFKLNPWVKAPIEPAGYYHVYNQFTIRTQQRDALKEHLRQDGILTEIYYPYPLHLEPAFAFLGYKPGDFPACERACSEVLSLPIFPELDDKQLRAVVQAVASFCTEQFERKPEVCNGAS
jgi:dTDP-4-amino-4,6-dideoxygalactose transaminase